MYGRTGPVERRDALAHASLHLRIESFLEVLFRNADAQPFDVALARGRKSADREACARRVARVFARDRLEQERGALHVPRERADLVQARSERDEPITRDTPV